MKVALGLSCVVDNQLPVEARLVEDFRDYLKTALVKTHMEVRGRAPDNTIWADALGELESTLRLSDSEHAFIAAQVERLDNDGKKAVDTDKLPEEAKGTDVEPRGTAEKEKTPARVEGMGYVIRVHNWLNTPTPQTVRRLTRHR